MGENVKNINCVIPVKGLSNGKHLYNFKLDSSFFANFDNAFIENADLNADVVVEKGSGWLRINAHIKGIVVVECDRCLDDLELPVDIEAPLQVKFSKAYSQEEDDSDDEFIIMDPTDGELDLSQFLYDYTCISLPLQKVHKEGECNEQMIKKLNETNTVTSSSSNDREAVNSPFGNIKELLEQKK